MIETALDEESLDPQVLEKRQPGLPDVNAVVLSLYAKGLTTGEISAHLADVSDASVSKGTVSAITGRMIADTQTWSARSLERVYAAVFIDAINVKMRALSLILWSVSAGVGQVSGWVYSRTCATAAPTMCSSLSVTG